MLEKAAVPHVAFDRDLRLVLQGRQLGRNVHFGNLYSPATQEAALELERMGKSGDLASAPSALESLRQRLGTLVTELDEFIKARA